MITFAAGIIIGGFISWAITHVYHKRSFREQKASFRKLLRKIREAIQTNSAFTVSDLNAILEKRTIDASSKDPLPYKACPKCGSINLIHGKDYEIDCDVGDCGEAVYTGTPFETIGCKDCGWEDSELLKSNRGE